MFRIHFSTARSATLRLWAFLAMVAAFSCGATSFGAQVRLTWVDRSSNESGFKIERAPGSSGGTFAQIATTSANVVSYTDTSVTAGAIFRYRVRAYNSAGHSAYSNTAPVTVPTSPAGSNTAPTISNISDRTISVNGNTGAIAFTVGDGQTSAGSLTLTGSSSNTTLVPASGITFGGSGANRTVTVRPASNRTGSATITVRVSDGSLSATDTFVVTVTSGSTTPTNTAPTISNISDRTISVNGNTGAIAFTVGDSQTSAGSLTLTGSSSNTTLVPASGITFGGSGANRTVTVRPASNRTGSATITVRVSDGSLSATDTFVVTVTSGSTTPTNTAPTISNISDRTISVNGNTGAIAFTVGDSQTSAGNLTLTGSSSNTTLVPASGITFGGSGANRTVTVRPASNRTGTATITVRVSDGSLSATDTFVLTVNSAATSTPSMGPVLTSFGAKFADIGNPAVKGTSRIDGDVITFTAAGAATSTASDQLSFLYFPLAGDSDITVRVASLTRAHADSRAGLMYRSSTAANAAHAAVYVTASSRLVLEWRSRDGATRQRVSPLSGSAPKWLRLMRVGNMIYALSSSNGRDWDLVEFASVTLPQNALAGLVATSQVSTSATTVKFDQMQADN